MRTHRRGRQGASLLAAVFSLIILVAATTVILQTYIVGSRAQRLVAQRDAVTVALEAQLETLRAGGYQQLPATGAHPLPPNALPKLPGVRGELAVAPGPVPASRAITARASWGEQRTHREELTIVMARQGMNP